MWNTQVNNTPVKAGANNQNKEEKMKKQSKKQVQKEEVSIKEMRVIAGGFCDPYTDNKRQLKELFPND